MKLFGKFSILLCAVLSFVLGMSLGDIQHTAADMVYAAAPVRYDVKYYQNGEAVVAENVLVSFDGDTATLSDGTVVSREFSEFTSRSTVRTARNGARTGMLALLLGGIAVLSLAIAAAFAVRLASDMPCTAGTVRTACRNVSRMPAQRAAAERRAA